MCCFSLCEEVPISLVSGTCGDYLSKSILSSTSCAQIRFTQIAIKSHPDGVADRSRYSMRNLVERKRSVAHTNLRLRWFSRWGDNREDHCGLSMPVHDLDDATVFFIHLFGTGFAEGHIHLILRLPPTTVVALPSSRTIIAFDTVDERERKCDDENKKEFAHEKAESDEREENKDAGMLREAIPRDRYFHGKERGFRLKYRYISRHVSKMTIPPLTYCVNSALRV